MLKKIGIFLIVIVCWTELGALIFKGSITDRYFVDPVGISKYRDRNNGVTLRQSNLLVPIELGTRRFAIPSSYLARIGYWNPEHKTYGGQLALVATGTDFKPLPGAVADSDINSLGIWIDVKSAPPEASLVKAAVPKILPPTVAEFDAGVKKDKSYWLREGLTRAPDLDRFGLLGYRDTFWGETYVGARAAGGILVFHCQTADLAPQPICEVFDARFADPEINVKYAFPKAYMAQWPHYDAGINRLVAGFARPH